MFKLHQKASPATEAIEYVTAGANLKIGVLVGYNADGKIVSNTTAPEFVTLGSAKNGETVALKRIYEDEVYETTSTGSPKVGTKVTVGADGESVTDTTASGIFEVISIDENKVRGMFRR